MLLPAHLKGFLFGVWIVQSTILSVLEHSPEYRPVLIIPTPAWSAVQSID